MATHLRDVTIGCLVALSFVVVAFQRTIAAERPERIAESARFDLLGDESVRELANPQLVRGNGSAERMHWVAADDEPRSLTVDFTIWPLGWREFELRFEPTGSGNVTLRLMGMWESDGKTLVKKEVLWDALEVSGAKLADGSFEKRLTANKGGWQVQGGTIADANAELPAFEGRRYARTWHDGVLVANLQVTAGQPVTIRGRARAVFPVGQAPMARITSRDTPAHRALNRFKRGVNLGNDLEVPPGKNWGAYHSADDFEAIQKEGFDHVRIPIAWHHYTGRSPEFLIAPGFFRKVDFAVDEARKRQLNVIINLHHFEQFTSSPDTQRARFLAIWRQVAEHFSAAGPEVAFELLNEPKDAATTEKMNDIYAEAIREIRRTNPNRTIFVGPGHWNATNELPKLRLPEDDLNLIVTVHCYRPMQFTHQGAPWGGPDLQLRGICFPGPPATPLVVPPGMKLPREVRAWIDRYNRLPTEVNPSSEKAFAENIDEAREWSEYFGRPVHFGEFGAILKADSESRANYYRAMRERIEAGNMGWAIWDWEAEFRYWDSSAKRPMPGMHDALFGK